MRAGTSDERERGERREAGPDVQDNPAPQTLRGKAAGARRTVDEDRPYLQRERGNDFEAGGVTTANRV